MLGRKHVIAVTAAFVAAIGLAAVPAATAAVSSAALARQPAPIVGAGSTWAYPALNQWATNLVAQGLNVSYTPVGSDEGRSDYQQETVDFAASDVPYRHSRDKLGNVGPEHVFVGYSYVPDVGGAVAFLYHVSIHGHLITNLRLSGETILKIFTGQITNWDNPAITRDYGRRIPSTRIIPVVHAGSAGATYYFTSWLAHIFRRQWNAFCHSVHRRIRPPCGPTAFYPRVGNARAESSSGQVDHEVQGTNGAIGYDEYAYTLPSQTPVVRLLNPAGRYVLPLSGNVTTALRSAVVNDDHSSPEFLQEDLDGVYKDKNPHSYPVSYYGYLIVPRSGTTLPAGFTDAKGNTISQFAYYGLCDGQKYAASLGYSPLPGKLIRNGLRQVARIPGHFPMPPLSDCSDLPH